MIKRTLDIVGSIVLLVLLALPMAVIAVLIRFGSPGGALFGQRRAGWRGEGFVMFKFRTMRTDVDPYGHSPHSRDDPRLTRMGRFLRETSLDELPQLLNVLAGSMSLVGPRPLYERQAARWDANQRRRLDVRPGISGYAQAFGRGGLTHEEKIELDLHYVDNSSLWLDAKILFRTAMNVVTRRGEVYEQRYSSEQEYESDQSE